MRRLALLGLAVAAIAATAGPARADHPTGPGEYHTSGQQEVHHTISPLSGPVGTAVRLVGRCRYGGQPAEEYAFNLTHKSDGYVYLTDLSDTRPDGSFESVLVVDERFPPGTHRASTMCFQSDFAFGHFETTFTVTDKAATAAATTTTRPKRTTTTPKPAAGPAPTPSTTATTVARPTTIAPTTAPISTAPALPSTTATVGEQALAQQVTAARATHRANRAPMVLALAAILLTAAATGVIVQRSRRTRH